MQVAEHDTAGNSRSLAMASAPSSAIFTWLTEIASRTSLTIDRAVRLSSTMRTLSSLRFTLMSAIPTSPCFLSPAFVRQHRGAA